MIKKIGLVIITTFYISIYAFGINSWIRINRLGYLPNSVKKAIFLSEAEQNIKQFSIHDALTNEEVAVFNSVTTKGKFNSSKSTFILDFSSFKNQGAFYIKANQTYSPTIYINKNIYLGSADFLLKYLRQQRCGNNTEFRTDSHPMEGYETTGTDQKFSEFRQVEPDKSLKSSQSKYSRKGSQNINVKLPKSVDIAGGWHESGSVIQSGSISAVAVYQLLFSYQMNPGAFSDKYDANGNDVPNGIPDVLDEAKWGLDWLLKMYPENELMYHQVGENTQNETNNISFDERVSSTVNQEVGRPVFIATGKPQGFFTPNHSNGIASIAGKYSSAFALGSQLLAKYYPAFADSLSSKAINAFTLGKNFPGVCQGIPYKTGFYSKEDNWSDDMEQAAIQLYQLTFNPDYLKEGVRFGRMEPVSPWMCSDTLSHYQWYPFINYGHFMLVNVENPRYQNEFKENLLNGLRRMSSYASANPFNVGVPLVVNSNNLIVALASECRLYRSLTNDSSFLDMETCLTDWLFGRNPWGKIMLNGLIGNGTLFNNTLQTANKGSLISGAVQNQVYNSLQGINLDKNNNYERFQSDWAVFYDDNTDFVTNVPSLDATTSLSYLLSGKQSDGVPAKTVDKNQYSLGAITSTDSTKKQISLVFAEHQFTDGYKTIRSALKKLNIKASFFFTGDFYRSGKNKPIIETLISDGHYLGGYSDKYLLYCSLQNHDSMNVTKSQFSNDLKANYKAMERFGIAKNLAPFFLPSREWHNDSIAVWCREVGIQLINCTPELLSNKDISIPEMRENYFPSTEIYSQILQIEAKQGLNGNIMLFHLGNDNRRKDKFYTQLYKLLFELSKKGYDFVDLYKATDSIDLESKPDKKIDNKEDTKEKRKN